MTKSRGLGVVSMGVILSWAVGVLFLSGEEASASEESCRALWAESSAAESCGPPTYPENTSQVIWEEQGDTCTFRFRCLPHACEQDMTIFRKDVRRLHNCDCRLKVGSCPPY